MTLLETGAAVLAHIRRAGFAGETELYLTRGTSRSIYQSRGRPEGVKMAREEGLGLRLIENGRQGFACANEVSLSSGQSLFERIRPTLSCVPSDPHRRLPKSDSTVPVPDLGILDAGLDQGWETRAGTVREGEARLLALDRRISSCVRAGYSEYRYQTAVCSSAGAAREYEGTHLDFFLECAAEERGETQLGYAARSATAWDRIDWEVVVREAADQALSQLGGRPIASGRYPVILCPSASAELLDLIGGAFRADQIQKGRSYFRGRLGQQVAASGVTIVDDPRMIGGTGSSPFDAEGVPTRRLEPIRQGELREFFYDSYTAFRDGVESTGSAGRSSYKALPAPHASNLYWVPGEWKPERILGEFSKVVYARSLMGLHTVDTVTGEFSLGLTGQFLERGSPTRALRGVTVSGNLFELLKSIVLVGNDLTFFGSVGAPTIAVEHLSIGGPA